MDKTDPRWDDQRITPSTGNVFVDLGFDPAEAAVMALRTELMVRIEMQLEARKLTQLEAAKLLGITQPRVSKLMRGVWRDFSIDMLLTLANRVGLHPTLTWAA